MISGPGARRVARCPWSIDTQTGRMPSGTQRSASERNRFNSGSLWHSQMPWKPEATTCRHFPFAPIHCPISSTVSFTENSVIRDPRISTNGTSQGAEPRGAQPAASRMLHSQSGEWAAYSTHLSAPSSTLWSLSPCDCQVYDFSTLAFAVSPSLILRPGSKARVFRARAN